MWYDWLWSGFEQLGYTRRDHTTKKLSSNTLGFDCPMMMEIKGKRVAYDYADFTRVYRPEVPRDYTFKIQSIDYRTIPIAQISGKLEIDTYRHKLFNEGSFDYDVIGMFRTTNYHKRLRWIELVSSMGINSKLSLYQTPDRPRVPEHISQERPKYKEHWHLQSRSKICLAIPGIGYEEGSTWSFRHTEILAMGRFLLMPKSHCRYPDSPRDCWVECEDHRLKDAIIYYLKNDKEREEIAQRGKKYYEDYIRPAAMASYILRYIS